MIMTSNCGFGERAEIFGDSVVVTALLDRLLHHAVVILIEGNSCSGHPPEEQANVRFRRPPTLAVKN